MSLPYPGCEFFKDYRDNGYSAEGLVYDWKQHFVDADLIVPNDDHICDQLNVDWNQYRNWDVIRLTQNYLKLTPLFTSLLRLSLWADGKIHQNLSSIEILFLTISYDWFLFGHNLNDRLSKGEEILFFCFYFLKYITSEEFSIDFLTNKSIQDVKERKPSVDQLIGGEVSQLLLEENNTSAKYGGSSSSLNSSCSSASTRSHDNCPPLYFPIFNTGEDLFFKAESDSNSNNSSYGKTPPTLTNSEEGSSMFANSSVNTSVLNRYEEPLRHICTPKHISNGCNSRTTEPVAIPVHKKVVNNVDNGLSSLSRSDSWQIVSDTGSIREGSMRYSSPDSISSPKTNGNSVDTSSSSNSDNCEPKHSIHANVKRERDLNNGKDLPRTHYMRRERLQSVRSIFYNSYSSAIGFKFKNGGDNNPTRLATLIDQFAGLYSSRVTAPQ
ncbi:unnamed protein product [Oppiella nova]|uniref:Uncharacterized protein n=1 Tax=Oppiella nova TaxID=334625 RepID=A0A7R9M5L8_9ACAR|nr:unnamed protein product [Oppiella nova]CAG2171191.1 unnamed protein product [Oppiella nova]